MTRRRNFFVLLFVIALLALSGVAITTKDTKLGLDLSGGTELIYQGRPTPQQPKVTAAAVDRAIEIVRQRIDQFGVAEPEVSRLGADGISIGLPAVQNAQRAIDQVGTTAQLYFYDWEKNVIPKSRAENPFTDLFSAVQFAAKQTSECIECSAPARFYLFTKGKHPKLVAGPETKKADLFVTLTGEKRGVDGQVIQVPQGTLVLNDTPEADPVCASNDCFFVLKDQPSLSGTDIKDPRQGFDQGNQPNVTFSFTDDGRKAFQEVTRAIAIRGQSQALPGEDPSTASQHFVVVLDNDVVSRPIINYAENPDGIDGRTGAEISGSFTIGKAQDLADFLRIGALPITLKLISSSQVSATLGDQALNQGLKAALAGLIVVAIFLLVLYRLLGLIATVGIGAYGILLFALIKLIPITLTLPGIAGLILTIGVAADTNIIIFERVKEEVRAGRSIQSAIVAGYTRGISTIIDANVVTLLTAFILFVLATAGVKGFAFVLGVGTIVSLLTAVLLTQALLGTLGGNRLFGSAGAVGAGEQRFRWKFDFMGASRYFFTFSGLILVIGSFSLATKQLNFGIDFESGTRVKLALEQKTDENGVRDSLAKIGINRPEVQAVSDKAIGDNAFQIQTEELKQQEVNVAVDQLDKDFGVNVDTFQSQTVGPTFGEQVARSALYAVIFSLILISGYIALRFDPKFAVPVLIALLHDILITAGVFALSGREVSSATVAAFLTILGFSLYDTIIVFDRIRENLPRMPRAAFSQVVNRSMSEVLTRSLATALCELLPILALLIFGGETLKDFAFAMLVGIASGTYSSIFIASPVLTAWKEREPGYQRRRARIEESTGGIVPAYAVEGEVAKLGGEISDSELEEHARERLAAASDKPSRRRGRRSKGGAVAEAEAPSAVDVLDSGTDDETALRPDPEPEAPEAPQPPAGEASESARERAARRSKSRQQGRKHGRNR